MYCANCGKKIPDDSKFCPECGDNIPETNNTSAPKKEKPKRSRAYKIANVVGFVIIALVILGVIFYIATTSKSRNLEVYKHPAMGFSVMYPKTLTIEVPNLPSGSKCSKDPCLVVFKDPLYGNEAVNWIFVLPAADLGGQEFITGVTTGFQEDVKKGDAVTVTIKGKALYKYVNDSAKPSESLDDFYATFGFDSSREQSMYSFISDDAVVLIGFRTPPSGAPSDYSDYLNIKFLLIP